MFQFAPVFQLLLSVPIHVIVSASPKFQFVVLLPLLTGMGVVSGWSPQPATSGALLYPLPLAIHLLSVELLFLWLPFGKLAHTFLVFMSRGITGAELARKGASL